MRRRYFIVSSFPEVIEFMHSVVGENYVGFLKSSSQLSARLFACLLLWYQVPTHATFMC